MEKAETDRYTIEEALTAFSTNLREDLASLTKIAPEAPLLDRLTDYFSGSKLASSWRESELLGLRDALIREKSSILVALETDLGVSLTEAELIEFVPLLQEIEHVIRSHRSWFKQSLPGSLADVSTVHEGSKVVSLPAGNVLILGQAGNELHTVVRPLIYAIAAGNYSLVAPQVVAGKHTTLWTTLEFILRKQMSQERLIIVEKQEEWEEVIGKNKVHLVVDGRKGCDKEATRKLCAGKSIKYLAHGHLKNIAIVDKHADLADAGRQIGAHKFYKAGQDYNNIDVVYVHADVHSQFAAEMKNSLFWHRGNRGPVQFQHGKMLDEESFKIVKEIVKSREGKHGELLTSQFINKDNLQVNPALLLNPTKESEILTGKNQSPVLPIVTFTDLTELMAELSQKEQAHNLYYFSSKKFLFEEAKSLLPGRNLYHNCTSFYLKSGMTPNFVSNWMPHASLQGMSAFHTFSRQKLFTWDNKRKYSIAESRLF